MKTIIARHPLLFFFLMALLFSWIAVAPLILNQALPVEPFQILGTFAGPTLAAVIVLSLTEGQIDLAMFFKRYFQWRAGIGWWLIVLFGVLIVLNVVVSFLLGSSILTDFLTNFILILPTYLITLLVGVLLGPLWEGRGWRGSALPRLQAHYGPVVGSLILAIIWAIWHAPGYASGYVVSGFPALLAYCMGFSILATWIYNNTCQSTLLMILLHSSRNAAISAGANILPTALSDSTHAFVFSSWIPALTGGIMAGLILLLPRGGLSYKKQQ